MRTMRRTIKKIEIGNTENITFSKVHFDGVPSKKNTFEKSAFYSLGTIEKNNLLESAVCRGRATENTLFEK